MSGEVMLGHVNSGSTMLDQVRKR